MAEHPPNTDAERLTWDEIATRNGIVLSGVDLNSGEDMQELYSMLGVRGVAATSRLRAYIRDLQQQQQQVSEFWVQRVSYSL